MGNPGYTLHPSEARASEALAQLALDLRWSWNDAADELWRGRLTSMNHAETFLFCTEGR